MWGHVYFFLLGFPRSVIDVFSCPQGYPGLDGAKGEAGAPGVKVRTRKHSGIGGGGR